MHWADVVAHALPPGDQTIATGITPSGHIHVGNMREMLTADLVRRAVEDAGHRAELIYIGDTIDPLRKVYPFLDEKAYAEHVGRPLSSIPCPCGGHDSYASHFLEPFLETLEGLGIPVAVRTTHEMYAQGRYESEIRRFIGRREEAAAILGRISGRKIPEGWYPYQPICRGCGRIPTVRVTGFEDPYVRYICACGYEGRSDIRTAEGKLPWRLEWPARWHLLGVTCEPFGKDHATSGGSYETGAELIRRILGGEPPHPVVYEWIQLKGKGAMKSSKGVVVRSEDLLRAVPPETFRYLISRVQPTKHIDFDPGQGLLQLAEEFDRTAAAYAGGEPLRDENLRRAFELACIGPPSVLRIPFRHLLTIVQLKPDDEEVLKSLRATGHLAPEGAGERDEIGNGPDAGSKAWIANARARIANARAYLEMFAPDEAKLRLLPEPPPDWSAPPDVLAALAGLRAALETVAWGTEEVQGAVFDAARGAGAPPGPVFGAIYRGLLGRERGPRVGTLFVAMGRPAALAALDTLLGQGGNG